jgi:hypothetical protein
VGSGDDEGFATGEELFAQESGHGGEGNAVVKHALDFGVAAGERVADDDEVRHRIEIGFAVRLGGFVGAGDAVALELQKAGE